MITLATMTRQPSTERGKILNYNFSIKKGFLYCTNEIKTIISDSIEFHRAIFSFDDDWIGFAKTISFTNASLGLSIATILDIDESCLIPFEILEASGDLIVCIKGTKDDSVIYTNMPKPIAIVLSDKVEALEPSEPTVDIYNQLINLASDKYVDTFNCEKTILTTDWQSQAVVFPIVDVEIPFISNGTTQTLSVGNFTDYLDRTSYPFEDFSLALSTDNSTTFEVVATSETGAVPNLRRINFVYQSNTYEVRISTSQITIRRASGSLALYVHQMLLRFDDIFYYDLEIRNQYYQTCLKLQDESKAFLKNVTFSKFPPYVNGRIRLNFSQIPSGNINLFCRANKTNVLQTCAEWQNVYGSCVYSDISDESISDSTTLFDSNLATIEQIKAYVNSKL